MVPVAIHIEGIPPSPICLFQLFETLFSCQCHLKFVSYGTGTAVTHVPVRTRHADAVLLKSTILSSWTGDNKYGISRK
jgi:hypothetical protein